MRVLFLVVAQGLKVRLDGQTHYCRWIIRKVLLRYRTVQLLEHRDGAVVSQLNVRRSVQQVLLEHVLAVTCLGDVMCLALRRLPKP